MILIMMLVLIVTIWFTISALYMSVYSFSALFYSDDEIKPDVVAPRIAIFIPAYKEDAVIVEVARQALKQDYRGEFDVVVISDSLKESTDYWLQELPISLVKVDFEKSTKAKALNYALNVMGDRFDLAIVLDADNVMEKGVVQKFADQYMAGHHAVQGHRCAKNAKANFAVLDAISEEVNNHIYCKGPSVLNLSSRLVGSGMAFDYQLFKGLMKQIDAVGGFDKALELKIIEQGQRIYYAENIIIYDEKVEKAEVFGNQRTRWISAQYHYMIEKMPAAVALLFKGNFDYFYKAIQLCLPPRLLFPGFLAIGSLLLMIVEWSTISYVWSALFVLVTLTYLVAIPARFFNRELLRIPFALGHAFLITLFSLFKLKGANNKFIHTPHSGLELVDNGTKTDKS